MPPTGFATARPRGRVRHAGRRRRHARGPERSDGRGRRRAGGAQGGHGTGRCGADRPATGRVRFPKMAARDGRDGDLRLPARGGAVAPRRGGAPRSAGPFRRVGSAPRGDASVRPRRRRAPALLPCARPCRPRRRHGELAPRALRPHPAPGMQGPAVGARHGRVVFRARRAARAALRRLSAARRAASDGRHGPRQFRGDGASRHGPRVRAGRGHPARSRDRGAAAPGATPGGPVSRPPDPAEGMPVVHRRGSAAPARRDHARCRGDRLGQGRGGRARASAGAVSRQARSPRPGAGLCRCALRGASEHRDGGRHVRGVRPCRCGGRGRGRRRSRLEPRGHSRGGARRADRNPAAPGDARAWAAQIEEIAGWSEERRAGFVARAQDVCDLHFTWSRVARETAARYRPEAAR